MVPRPTAHLMVRRNTTDVSSSPSPNQQQGDEHGDRASSTQQQQQSYCSLEVSICDNTDICRLKGTLTSRRTGSTLQEVQLDMSGLFRQNQIRNKKLRPIFKALGDLPLLETLKFHYNNGGSDLERLPVHLIQIALTTRSNGNGSSNEAGQQQQRQQANISGGGGLKILEFHQVNLTGTTKEFGMFYDTIRNNCNLLEVFSFSTSGISSSSNMNELLLSLSGCPKLRRLSLYSDNGRSPWGRFDGSSIQTLVSSSSTTNRLRDFQHLVLYDSGTRRQTTANFFTDEHTIALAQGLQQEQEQGQEQQTSALVSVPAAPIHNHNNNNNTLQEVMISCWPLGRAGVRALCEMLPTNRSLRKLTIVIYELGDDNNTQETCNVSRLATQGLTHNNTLQTLELHHTSMELGKWIAEPFWNLVTDTNFTLRQLKLSSNDDALFCKPYLDFYLKLNAAGRHKLLRGGGGTATSDVITKVDWIDSLIRVRNDASCLFYFLSTNPLLCALD